MQRKPIPWLYKDNGQYKNWDWETPHFIVKIIGEGSVQEGGAIFNWQIIEKKNGQEYIFEASTSRTFREAENEIVEIIAKSWDKRYGYDIYAGKLATTFQIYGNTKLDIEQFVGHKVKLVISEDGKERTLEGIFAIKNYNFLLKNNNERVISIQPLTVKEIIFS